MSGSPRGTRCTVTLCASGHTNDLKNVKYVRPERRREIGKRERKEPKTIFLRYRNQFLSDLDKN
jgi:hypothetical protein